MNARKLLDKMRGWVLHDSVMKQELLEAGAEFFAFYEGPQDGIRDENLSGLFVEWFLYDRKTTRYFKTPVEVFLQYGARGLTKTEKDFYKKLPETIFGLFEVLASDKEAGLVRVKRLDGEGEWNIKDAAGSRGMAAGNVLFARIVPLADTPLFTGWVVGFPEGAAGIKESLGKSFGTSGKISPLKPRYLLMLWTNPINWIDKGEFYCKTRLAGIWQRWCGKKGSFSELEAAVDAGDHGKYLLAEKTLLENCPDHGQLNEIMGLLEAYWNLASGKKAGLKPPVELIGPGPGAVERKYIKLLGDATFERHKKTGLEFSKEETDAWFKDIHNGENGLSPFDLISKERKSNNHPYPDEISYSMTIQGLENKAAEAASEKHNAALDSMVQKDFKKAAVLFEEALLVLKHDKSVSFRIFGNLGICYALMGEREKSFEALREALRHNPDYDRARRHLSELEAMSEAQYKKFLKTGPDSLTHTEWHE